MVTMIYYSQTHTSALFLIIVTSGINTFFCIVFGTAQISSKVISTCSHTWRSGLYRSDLKLMMNFRQTFMNGSRHWQRSSLTHINSLVKYDQKFVGLGRICWKIMPMLNPTFGYNNSFLLLMFFFKVLYKNVKSELTLNRHLAHEMNLWPLGIGLSLPSMFLFSIKAFP